jgi:hypothetical protein
MKNDEGETWNTFQAAGEVVAAIAILGGLAFLAYCLGWLA